MVTDFDTQFTQTITWLFGAPFYTGTSASSADVPNKYQMALDGHPFMLEGEPLWRSIPTMRDQQDDREVGELSLNPEALWRRSASSWEMGAGQIMYDDENSQRQRFRSSKGLDVWTPGELKLLPATELHHAVDPTANQVQIVSTIEHVYFADLQTVYRADLVGAPVAVTGTPTEDITSMVSTGSYVLVGYASSGIYKIAAGATTAATWMVDTVSPSVVGWAKGRVIVTVGNVVYNPITAFTSADSLPASMFVHPDADFEWVGVAEGTSWIYMGGTVGDKSTIYRTAVRADGTALDVLTVAGRLPDGEMLTTIYGYLGIVLLGTTRGFRVAQPNGNGDLVLGALVDIGAAVEVMMGRGTFIYFGWSNYDVTSTGIGRMDLSNLTDVDNLVPAYASDLMATVQGTVAGIAYCTTIDGMAFGVNGSGIYKESTTDLVTSGTIEGGIIRYGLTEEKVVTGARAGFTGPGTVTLALATNTESFAPIGETGVQERGVNYELRATITQSGTHVSPAVESITLYAYPAPEGTIFIDATAIIADKIQTRDGIEVAADPVAMRTFLLDRYRSKVLVSLQLGVENFQVTLEQMRFQATNESSIPGVWNGAAPLSMKVIT